jgi:glycosyltransferase involved in cell wall biosynthesis
MDSKLSVVIPAYNEEEKIGDCLDAFLNQSIMPKEIIVVDGGSKDRTIAIVKEHQKKSKIIKLLKEGKKRSPANARNIGWKNAKGSIIVFKDADTIPDRKYVETIEKNFSENVMEFPAKSFLKKDVSFLEKLLFYREASPEKMHETIFSKKYLKRIGGYNANLGVGEDMELKSRTEKDVKKTNATLIVAFARVSSLSEFIKRYIWYGRTIPNYIYKTRNILGIIRSAIAISLYLLPLIYFLSNEVLALYLLDISLLIIISFSLLRGIKILKKYSLAEAIFILPVIEFIAFLALGFGIFVGLIQRLTGKFYLGR